MRILGIDTGLAITGWSIVDKDSKFKNGLTLIDCGAILTDPKMTMNERLVKIFEGISQIIDKYKPEVMAIEDLFYFKNKKTVIKVSQARGVIIVAAAKKSVPVVDYTPLQVKSAVTGYGRADKAQVQKMVALICNLEEVPKPDDIADAIAIGICHANSDRSKI